MIDEKNNHASAKKNNSSIQTPTFNEIKNQLLQHQAIINSVSDAIITTDLAYNIQTWNKAAEKIYGWAAHEVIGNSMGEIVPTGYLGNDNAENVNALFQKQGFWQGDVIQTTRTGENLFIHASVNLIVDTNNNPTSVVAVNRDITDFKKNERALQNCENQSRTLINAVNHTLFLMKPDGTIMISNEALAGQFSKSANELVGANVFDLLPDEVANHRRKFAKKAIERGKTSFFVDKRADREFENQIRPLKNDVGDITHLAVFSQDITEKNKIKRALKRSEQQFRTVLETVQMIGLMLDAEGNITFCNDYLLSLTNWQREEVIGQNWFNTFLPTKVQAGVSRIFQKTFESGEFPPYYENKIITRDGKERLIGWNNTALWDNNGRVIGVTSIGQDITEQRQKEDELRRLTRAIEQSPVSVMVTDLKGNIEYVNPKFTEVTGYTYAEAVGNNPRMLNSGEQDEQFYLELWNTISSGQSWHGEFLNKRKNGEPFWEAASISPNFDTNGRITSYVAVKEEITEQRKMQDRLRQQERLAAVGQLAAGIAHDFNNILTVILLYGELLQKSPELTSKQQPKVQTIIKQSQRATELIEQILDFSHQSVLKREALDLLPLVQDMVKMLERTLPENLRLQLNYHEKQFPILADRTRMQQVLMNLCVNARDSMPNGGSLEIGLASHSIVNNADSPPHLLPPGDWIKLSVEDTGSGIDEDVLPHIFEPFFTTKAPGHGNGLGLAQVYGIIKQHDGDIDVTSQPNAGTQFSIFLPLLHSMHDNPNLPTQKGLPRGQGETILIVEDDRMTRQSLVDTLEHLNYTPISAENGRIALDRLDKPDHSIQLILSDVVMPEIGGIALLKILHSRGNTIPIILITGHLLSDELDVSKMKGLHSFISKPPKLEVIAETIQSALKTVS
ncbi:MAG: PAS domain S-box protein [Chloroflexi bacterium]|nr:MAG: PAS domain S-box protein [Chloroflexota bacterium]